MQEYADVLNLWFGSMEQGVSSSEYRKRWYTGGAAFDELLREQFLAEVESALAGELVEWEQSAEGVLALIILLDQLPRNLFRGDKRAFSGDNRAIQLAKQLCKSDDDRQLQYDQRVFVYMPYMHSESLEDQQECIELFKQLKQDAPKTQQDFYQSSVDYAVKHMEIVKRFGRFPHRNQVLERKTTSEEQQWLDSGGERFGQ